MCCLERAVWALMRLRPFVCSEVCRVAALLRRLVVTLGAAAQDHVHDVDVDGQPPNHWPGCGSRAWDSEVSRMLWPQAVLTTAARPPERPSPERTWSEHLRGSAARCEIPVIPVTQPLGPVGRRGGRRAGRLCEAVEVEVVGDTLRDVVVGVVIGEVVGLFADHYNSDHGCRVVPCHSDYQWHWLLVGAQTTWSTSKRKVYTGTTYWWTYTTARLYAGYTSG
jgi:hypothetical protein